MKTLLAAMFLIAPAIAALADPPSCCQERPKIAVGGESVVYAKPDRVNLAFSIEASGEDLPATKQKNAEIWKKAVAVLKESGVADKDVQTGDLPTEPFGVAHSLFIIKLSDAGQVGPLVTKMLAIGVTNLPGIEFQTTDLKRLREMARELALKAAREKAQKMAAVLGCTIGKPLSVSEGDASFRYTSSWDVYVWENGSSSTMSQGAAQGVNVAGGEDSESMALGKISIRASVSVTFELKDNSGP